MGLHTGLRRAPRRRVRQRPRCTGPPGWPPPPTAGRCSARRSTARRAEPLPDGASLLDLGLHRLRGFDDRERLFQLVAPGLERQFPRPRTADAVAHNLPTQVTSFVGREAERAELRRLVEAHRLVTVVGAGGAGKTRLAVELPPARWSSRTRTGSGSSTSPRSPTRAWWRSRSPPCSGCARSRAGPMVDTLVEYAAARRMLVVLDTCDAQPAASAELISRLLAGGSGVRVLATSREPFGLPGEVVWRIPPLSVDPRPGGADSDAVALLLDRTAAARGGRPPDPAEHGRPAPGGAAAGRAAAGHRAGRGPAAGALRRPARRRSTTCWAPWTPAGTTRPPGRAAGGNQQDTVTWWRARAAPRRRPGGAASASERHLTMQATVTWSYRTLGRAPARLLRWLAVFAGPVDLPTVEWLLDEDPLDPLAVLVDKSMVLAEPHAAGSTTGCSTRSGRTRHGGWSRPARSRPPGTGTSPGRGTRWSGRTSGRTAGRSPSPCTRWTRSPGSCGPRCAGAPPAAAPGRACGWPAGWTSGGGSAGWPGRAGSGCSGCTAGSPRPASRSRRRSWRRRTTCTRCMPARTVSSPRSCATPSGPRRPPGRPATRACWPGCWPAGPRRWSTWGSSTRPSGSAGR